MNARFYRNDNFFTLILKFILFFILLYSLNALAVGSRNDSIYKEDKPLDSYSKDAGFNAGWMSACRGAKFTQNLKKEIAKQSWADFVLFKKGLNDFGDSKAADCNGQEVLKEKKNLENYLSNLKVRVNQKMKILEDKEEKDEEMEIIKTNTNTSSTSSDSSKTQCQRDYHGCHYNDAFLSCLKEAEEGVARSQTLLANIYAWSLGDVPEDKEKSKQLYIDAAKADDSRALAQLGINYVGGINIEKNVPKGIELINKSIDRNYRLGFFLMGEIYRLGLGGHKKDVQKAKSLLLQGIARGDLNSHSSYGDILWRTDKNGKEGLKHKLIAANSVDYATCGLASAQFDLGNYYLDSIRDQDGNKLIQGEHDVNESLKWFQKGADNGEEGSLYNIAFIHETEFKDLDQAFIQYYQLKDSARKDINELSNAKIKDFMDHELISQKTIDKAKGLKAKNVEQKNNIINELFYLEAEYKKQIEVKRLDDEKKKEEEKRIAEEKKRAEAKKKEDANKDTYDANSILRKRLEELKSLYSDELITKDEYEEKKKEILDNL